MSQAEINDTSKTLSRRSAMTLIGVPAIAAGAAASVGAAEKERRLISERTRAALAAKKERGATFGYPTGV